MSFWKSLAFYPTSLALRFKLTMARSLLQSPFRWHALDRLGIPGHGTDLIRIDFPPAMLAPPRWGHGNPVHPGIAARLDENRHEQVAWLQRCLAAASDCLRWPEDESPAVPELPWLRNEFLTRFDLVSIYGMLRELRPDRYLEIGSGLSTRVAWQARRNGTFPMEIISVDPEPRREVSRLCDQIHRRRLEDMATEFLELVTPRTVVFFDGSHRSFPASDVTVFFLEILPRLPVGTTFHIHDIYLPADYPAALGHRFWSEQYVLAAYLLGGARRLKILLPCARLAATTAGQDLLDPVLGPTSSGSSFWAQVI